MIRARTTMGIAHRFWREKRNEGRAAPTLQQRRCDEEVQVGLLLLAAVILEQPAEAWNVAQARDLALARGRANQPQPAEDQRAAVVDGDGGFGLAAVEDRVDQQLAGRLLAG